jgi:amino acid transporter
VREETGRGDRPEEEPAAVLSPAAGYPPLSDDELGLLRQVGGHWQQALGRDRERLRALPVDPSLRRRAAAARWRGRFTPINLNGSTQTDVAASEQVVQEAAPFLSRARKAIVGPPLHSAAVTQERMRKLIALPVLASDALSSVAYGPQAMLAVLVLGGHRALGLSLPVAGAIAALMAAVGLSYRQTIRAYPRGGGSYIVASDNLGYLPGLAAAAGLMLDYMLTVAISVASGVAAVTSALPGLASVHVLLGLGMIVILVAGNLRGLRQGGMLFAAPTYLFIVAIYVLIVAGLIHAGGRSFHALPQPPVHAAEGVSVLLILRAFSSGATAMTGIEAIADGIPAFKRVEWRNARTTLTTMIALLLTMFAGTVVLTWLEGIIPSGSQTLLSQLAHRDLGHGILYGYVQTATALILLLAANTSFSDFPRLLFFLARDYSAPRSFMGMGDRLAFTNGIVMLGAAAAAIFVAFRGSVEHLIPLYAVGVFLAFTLSQTGMVFHWWRGHEAGWRRSIVFNCVGAFFSAVVLIITSITKFIEGAWIVVILVPALVTLFLRIRNHYDVVGKAVALHPLPLKAQKRLFVPPPRESRERRRRQRGDGSQEARSEQGEAGVAEQEEAPDQITHLAVVPVVSMDLATLRALAYATSLGQPVLAVHCSVEEDEARRFRCYWEEWGDHVRLEVIVSPYRALIAPLATYLEALHDQRPDLTITVVLPEIIVRQRWHELLHHHIAARLRRALRQLPGIAITTVPFHLPE